jgi:hypothetical protein
MSNVAQARSLALPRRERAAGAVQPDFMAWLREGRLTLVDGSQRVISVDDWADLPASTRANAIADFQRVVGGDSKAAVLFLRG